MKCSLVQGLSLGRALTVVACLAVTTLASAVPQPHPRIWLNTPTLTRLRAAQTANTPEWVALRNWCDSRLGMNLREGYQYLDWYSYTLNYGLAYQITGDTRYGNEGVIYLRAMLRDRTNIGDGLGGTNAIQIDSGYVSRSLGVGVAMGRDWLHGAPNLTPALIDECTTRMTEWYAWVHRPQTYGIAEPWVNYFAGHFGMTYCAFIAFEGDPGYQPVWETKSEAMWVLARNMFNEAGDGGDWPEGWNYGHRAYRHMIGYPWALETGTDRPNHWDEIDITSEIVLGQVSMLHPSREMISDDGRWTGDYKGDPRETTALMMSVLSDTDPTAKGLAVWFANHLEFQPGGSDYWEAMLFTDPSISEIAPSAATVGGLTYKMYGHAVARGDDWTNQEATFVDVVAWTDYAGEANFGDLKISSRQEQLVVDAQTYQLEASHSNIPRISGSHTYAPYQEYWHDDAVMTVDSLDGIYSYFKLANMDSCFDGVNNNNPSAAYFQRDILFLAPDHVVVLDNITATSLANTVAEQWHTFGNPTLSGDTAVLTRPNAKLFLRTVSPAVTLSKTDTDATRDGTWRIDAPLVTPAIQNHILTVFETTDETQSAMTPAILLNATGFAGVQVQSAIAPKIALFATAENAAHNTMQFTFTPTAALTRVVLTGMAPTTGFNVSTASGSGGTTVVSVTAGATYTSGDDGSLTFNVAPASASVTDWMMM